MLHNPKAEVVVDDTTPLFESFFILGAGAEAASCKPTILFNYPPDRDIDLPGIEEFCFPTGIPAHDSLAPVVDCAPEQIAKDSFAFQISTSTQGNLFGMCVHKCFSIKKSRSFIDEVVQHRRVLRSRARKNNSNKYVLCYCFISKFPFISFFFNAIQRIFVMEQMHYNDQCNLEKIERDFSEGVSMNPVSMLESPDTAMHSNSNPQLRTSARDDVAKAGTPLLRQLKQMISPSRGTVEYLSASTPQTDSPALTPPISMSPSMEDIPVMWAESPTTLRLHPPPQNPYPLSTALDDVSADLDPLLWNALQILNSLRDMKLPPPGKEEKFVFSPRLKPIVLSRPFIDEEEEMCAEWGLATLLTTIPKKDFYTIFTAVLLERKLIILCKSVHVLSAIILSFIPLLRPFKYQSVLIPVLPSNMLNFLDAPVPFTVGVPALEEPCAPPDAVVYDVDRLLFTSTHEPALPRLPYLDELERKLEPLLRSLRKIVKAADGVDPAAALGCVQSISTVFEDYLSCTFENFHEHCITDLTVPNTPITVFLKESFLAESDETETDFFKAFMETQMFFQFQDNRLRAKDSSKYYSSRTL
mmetsp:Transcript_28428/g.71405  ORF Transcript_28428/g.71405 Transcript_28428/m.71405 type:complete len:585 (+) Transcript_28428:128-1882(+)